MANYKKIHKRDKALRDYLPPYYSEDVYEKLNGRFSRKYIRRVVCGERHNIEIIDCAWEVADDYAKTLLTINKKSDKVKLLRKEN